MIEKNNILPWKDVLEISDEDFLLKVGGTEEVNPPENFYYYFIGIKCTF